MNKSKKLSEDKLQPQTSVNSTVNSDLISFISNETANDTTSNPMDTDSLKLYADSATSLSDTFSEKNEYDLDVQKLKQNLVLIPKLILFLNLLFLNLNLNLNLLLFLNLNLHRSCS